MSSNAIERYKYYATAFSAISQDGRRKILEAVLETGIQYRIPRMEGTGHQIILDDIQDIQSKFPGGRFVLYSFSAHHDVALMEWQLILADETPSVRGHDAIRMTPEGRIAQIITFAPSTPEPEASSNAVKLYKRYITAFSAIPDEQRRKILNSVLDSDVIYRNPRMEGTGAQIILDNINKYFQANFAGGSFLLHSVSEHHDVALMEWQLILADGTPGVRGHDAIRVTSEGRFAQIVTFAPSTLEPKISESRTR